MSKIVTIFENSTALSTPAGEIPLPDGLGEAKEIARDLIETIIPLMPAAGLAGPQIGISKKIFIYSWNRTLETMEAAINPKILFESTEKYTSWEACFSTMDDSKKIIAAKVSRPVSMDVEYYSLKQGKFIKKRLVGFGAKVFMHEYDHLSGIENVRKEGAETKSFTERASFVEFMRAAKNIDSDLYLAPIDL